MMDDGRLPSGRAASLTASAVPASRSGIPDAVNGLGVGRSNDWHTPPRIFEALGENFDLDVAAPVTGPLHVPCKRWMSESSLVREWWGFVWMNPPFGGRNGLRPWLTKFFDYGNGIALTPDRSSAPWFHEAYARADALLLTKGKTPFLLPCGSKAGSPAFGTALWASGPRAVEALVRAASRGLGALAFPAQGTPTRSAETNGLGPKDGGPVSEGNAPEPHLETPHHRSGEA